MTSEAPETYAAFGEAYEPPLRELAAACRAGGGAGRG